MNLNKKKEKKKIEENSLLSHPGTLHGLRLNEYLTRTHSTFKHSREVRRIVIIQSQRRNDVSHLYK